MNDMPWQVRFGLATSTIVLLAIALLISYIHNDDANRSMIIGAIISNATTIVSFYFGSSDSSRKKDEIIAQSGPATTTTLAPSGTVTTKTEPSV